MKTTKLFIVLIGITCFAACGSPQTTETNANKDTSTQTNAKEITITQRPDSIKEKNEGARRTRPKRNLN